MRLAIVAVAVTAAVITAVVAAAALAGGSGSTARTIKVVEHATTDAVTDTGKKGDTAGDLLTFANAVFNGADAKQIATDQGWCIRTVVGKAWECFWTTSLSGGQITVEGPFYDAGPSKLAITGGTGAYAGARGWMGLSAADPKGTKYNFVFHVL
jgi:hypothetical protein